MLLKYFYDRHLAQASYMLACQATGEAIVIDPARDITPYLQTAQQEGLRITHVTETHIHADFVSGVRELASKTQAQILLSGEGGDDWQYTYPEPFTKLYDGDQITVGNVVLDVLHTPGHTPEHIIFQFTDRAAADQPMGLITGDCLFVGDIGRPDLLETAAGVIGSKEVGARGQFKNIQRLRQLPDYLQVLPGHGAGSACGKALGAVPSSTLGYEKLFNPAFQFTDENAFVEWLLSGQPDTPRYFKQMKYVNRVGPTYLDQLAPVEPLEPFILSEVLQENALVIDTRPSDVFSAGYIKGTINIPPSEQFSTYANWFIDFDKPTYLIAEDADIPALLSELRAIGVDQIGGYFIPSMLRDMPETLPSVSVEEARVLSSDRGDDIFILDVRARSEFDTAHVEGASQIHYGHLENRLEELPKNQTILVHCASGYRSQIASSVLAKHGFQNVLNLRGGFNAWKAARMQITEGENV